MYLHHVSGTSTKFEAVVSATGKTWVEALPVGNSSMGAMVYGGTSHEELQLNEETLWGGGPYRNDNPKALESLNEVRKLILQERQWTHRT